MVLRSKKHGPIDVMRSATVTQLSYLIMIIFRSHDNVFLKDTARCRTCVDIAVSFLLAALHTTSHNINQPLIKTGYKMECLYSAFYAICGK